jgi:hypothetical protein
MTPVHAAIGLVILIGVVDVFLLFLLVLGMRGRKP